ncbi:MAG: hypothetical protein ACK5LK_08935, partial [Chthoniobacterales bacterium]
MLSKKQTSLTAIILAGTRPEGDPVADFAETDCKALVPILGQAMISYVLDAIAQSQVVKEIILVATPHDALSALLADVRSKYPNIEIEQIPPAATISQSVKKAIEQSTAPTAHRSPSTAHSFLIT